MNYQTLYEYIPGISKIFYIVPILVISILSFVGASVLKRTLEKNFRRQLILFLLYLFGGISSFMLILSIVKIPDIVSYETRLKKAIQNKTYFQVEGEVKNLSLQEINGQFFESFSINNINFEYSDYNNIDGYHITSHNNGIIKRNGQKFKISYFPKDSINLILKIERKNSPR